MAGPSGARSEQRSDSQVVSTHPRKSILHRLLPYTLLLVLMLEYLIFAAIKPNVFFSTQAFIAILSSQAPLLIATLGLTLTLIVREFDLTLGTTLVFTNVLVTVLTAKLGWPLLLAVLVALLSGTMIGVANAGLVVGLKIDSFIATLGMSTLFTGIGLWIAGSTIVSNVPDVLIKIVGTKVLGVPLVVYYAFLLAFILWYILANTPVGRYMYFVGSNAEVARLAGINARAIKSGAFIASAFIFAVAGVMQAGTVGAADPTAGPSFMLPAFAAAFLGATAVKVGKFNIWGTMIASYLLFTGITGLALLGFTGWVQNVFNGAALLIAVIAARFARRS